MHRFDYTQIFVPFSDLTCLVCRKRLAANTRSTPCEKHEDCAAHIRCAAKYR